MLDARPIGFIHKRRAVLVIVTSHALIARRKWRVRFRIAHVLHRWAMTILAAHAAEHFALLCRDESAGQGEAGRVALLAGGIDVKSLGLDRLERVRMF